MNGAHQCRPRGRFASGFCAWRSRTPTGVKYDDDQVEEGAHCRDQRDEQDTLEDDFGHMSASKTRFGAKEFRRPRSARAGLIPGFRDAGMKLFSGKSFTAERRQRRTTKNAMLDHA